mgnify:FL=1
MKLQRSSRFLPVFVVLLVLLFTAGCATPTPATLEPSEAADAVATMVAATMAASAQPVHTQAPTAEELPTLASSARVLVVTGGAPQAQADALAGVVRELAAQDGLNVESKSEITPGDLDGNVRVVVMAAPPANLDQLLQAGSGTQFVVVSTSSVAQEAANLSVITSNPAYETFLAGYIAELITGRIAPVALLPSDAGDTATLQDAFLTGGRFFCGACRLLPNFENVSPVVVAQPAASDAAAWNAAITPLAKFGLDVVYLPAESASEEVIGLLANSAQRVIGNFDPPAALRGKWVATVRADAGETLRSLWPDLMAGNGGQRLAARVAVTEIGAQWLTPGRQRLVTELRERLESGEVSPLEEK